MRFIMVQTVQWKGQRLPGMFNNHYFIFCILMGCCWNGRYTLLSSALIGCTSNIFFFFFPFLLLNQSQQQHHLLKYRFHRKKSSKFLQPKDMKKKKKLNPRPNIEALFFTYHTAFWDLPAVVFLHFNSISPVFVALIYISCSIFWLRCAEVDALMAQKLSCTHMTPWEHR